MTKIDGYTVGSGCIYTVFLWIMHYFFIKNGGFRCSRLVSVSLKEILTVERRTSFILAQFYCFHDFLVNGW